MTLRYIYIYDIFTDERWQVLERRLNNKIMKIKTLFAALITMIICTLTSCVHTAEIDSHEWATTVRTETQQWVHQEGWSAPTGDRTIKNLTKTKRVSGTNTVSPGGYVTSTNTKTREDVKTYHVWGYRTCSYCGVKHRSDKSCGCGNRKLDSPFTISEERVSHSDERNREGHFCSYCGNFSTENKCSGCGHSFDSSDKNYSSKFDNSCKKGNRTYKDLGNGQFLVTETTTKEYESNDMDYIPPVYEPEYSDYYEWEELMWRTNREFPASGTGTEVTFKDVNLQAGERAGHSSATYIIVYKVDDGTTITRTYTENEWRRLKDGQNVKVRKWWTFSSWYWVSQETAH